MARAAASAPPASPLESAKRDAYRLLARRPRTRKEILARLRERRHPDEIIETTLDSLAELGYINDEAFAREWCRHRLDTRPAGADGLRRELREKGVPAEIVENAIREAFDGIDESDLARRLALRRAHKEPASQSTRGETRIRNFLLRRGFSPDAVQEALAAVRTSSNRGSVPRDSYEDDPDDAYER